MSSQRKEESNREIPCRRTCLMRYLIEKSLEKCPPSTGLGKIPSSSPYIGLCDMKKYVGNMKK